MQHLISDRISAPQERRKYRRAVRPAQPDTLQQEEGASGRRRPTDFHRTAPNPKGGIPVPDRKKEPQAAPEGYVIIPAHILRHKDLSYAERIIFGRVLALMQNEAGCCWANNEYIAQTSGCRIRTVERAIPHLAELGLLSIEGGGGRGRRIYPSHSAELAELLRNYGGVLPRQNGDASPPKRRSSSRGVRDTSTTGGNTATNARIADGVLEYHHELRLKISPNAKPTTGRPKAQVLAMIGALIADGHDEEYLRAVCRGHLSHPWWLEQKKYHPKHAFADPIRAEEFAELGSENVGREGDDDDWFDDEDGFEDHQGAWEGLEAEGDEEEEPDDWSPFDADGMCKVCEGGGEGECDVCSEDAA